MGGRPSTSFSNFDSGEGARIPSKIVVHQGDEMEPYLFCMTLYTRLRAAQQRFESIEVDAVAYIDDIKFSMLRLFEEAATITYFFCA